MKFMRYIFVFIIIAFIMQMVQPIPSAYAIGGTWNEVTAGSASGDGVGTIDSTYPSLKIDSNGYPNMAILNELTADSVLFQRYNGVSWDGMDGTPGADTVDTGMPNDFIFEAKLTLANNDNPHIAWASVSGVNERVHYRYWNGAAWVGLGDSDTNGLHDHGAFVGGQVSIALHPVTQFPYIAWSAGGTGTQQIYLVHWNGASWQALGSSNTVNVGVSNTSGFNSFAPNVGFDEDGNLYVIWSDTGLGGSIDVFAKTWTGSQWVGPVSGTTTADNISSTSGNNSTGPEIDILDGEVYVVWQEDVSGVSSGIYMKKYNGSAWVALAGSATGPGGVSTFSGFGETQSPSISVARNGRPYIAYKGNFSSPNPDVENIFAIYFDGNAWQPLGNSQTITNGLSNATNSDTPSIGVDENGKPYVAWRRCFVGSCGTFRVYIREFNTPDALPVLVNNNTLNAVASAATTIPNTLLQTTDTETAAAGLTYKITSSPANGTLSLPNEFTQAQIDSNSLTYTNDGTTGADSFDFIVSDNYHIIGEYTFNINVSEPSGVTLSTSSVNVTEGGATATFDVTLDSAPTADVTVNVAFANGAPNGAQISSPTPPFIISSGTQGPLTLTVQGLDDTIFEGAHSDTITVSVSSGDSNYNGAGVSFSGGGGANNNEVTVNITDNDSQPTVNITPANVTQNEGDSGTTAYDFTVTLTNGSAQVVTVNYTTNDGTATTGDNDYVDNDSALVFNPGASLSQTITVNVNGDTKVELDEGFTVNLNSANNATVGTNSSTGTITNDDSATLSIDDVTQNEGNAGSTTFTFTVTLDNAVDTAFTVDYDTADDTATTADSDYVANTGNSLNFIGNAGETQTLDITVNGDTQVELDETFFVNLSNISAGGRDVTFGDSQGLGTITNDDSATLSIDDVTQNEGNAGTTTFTFTVSLDNAVGTAFTVDYDTADDTATIADSDYVANTGNSLNFAGNASETQTFDVTVNGDTKVELDETFFVNLINIQASGFDVTFADAQGVGTITNDDSATLSIDEVTQNEGNAGTTTFTFTVTLDNAVDAGVSVDYDTADDTATIADSDYVANTGNSLNFIGNAGETQTLDITVNGDTKVELDETFFVNLSNISASGRDVTFSDSQGLGTITNDDSATLSIDDVTQNEGNAGSTTFTFTVTLDNAVDAGVSVDYDTADDTATIADSDYVANTGNSLNFIGNVGETHTIDVTVNGDIKTEADESFFVNLSNIGAGGRAVTINDGQGLGTILNDDAPPEASIAPLTISQVEGDCSITTQYIYTVTLNHDSSAVVTINYTTNDGTATTGDSDYVDNDGALIFNPGDSLTQDIIVTSNGDINFESDESFTVTLNSATNGTINAANDTSTGTITNDDSSVGNDKFCGAMVVGSLPNTFNQAIDDATVSPSDPSLSCTANYTQSVWYSYTASSDRLLYVHTSGSNYDTVLAVMTGTEGSYNVLSCTTGNIGQGRPAITGVNMQSGGTYHVMVARAGSTPSAGNLSLTLQGLAGNDAVALFNPASSATELQTSVVTSPQPISYTNTPPTNTANIWVMGDWNGDGVDTPGYFDSGAFRYTNDIGATSNWSASIWLGNAGSRVAVVSGRYASGFANDSGNDCIGWVDSNTSPLTGDLRFSLKYWCDMTASGAVPLSAQWLGSPLGDSAGFTGTFQFAYGDWDNDGLDEPGIRRSSRIVRSDTAPQEGAATYPAGSAQRWDTADGDGPGAHDLDAGLFVAGDWNGDSTDTWGVVYDDNTFYYRDVFGFNPGPYAFSSQTFVSNISAPRQVASHANASGGSSVPGPAGSTILRTPDNAEAVGLGGTVDTSQNVEAELSVSKAGNYQVGEVGLVGDSIVWTITVANTGTAPANGVQITDNVPSELRVDDALAANGTITVRGQTVIFTVESIGVGETAQFQVVTTILNQPTSGTFANSVNVVLPEGNGSGSDANLLASGTVNSVDGLPATGYSPRFRW